MVVIPFAYSKRLRQFPGLFFLIVSTFALTFFFLTCIQMMAIVWCIPAINVDTLESILIVPYMGLRIYELMLIINLFFVIYNPFFSEKSQYWFIFGGLMLTALFSGLSTQPVKVANREMFAWADGSFLVITLLILVYILWVRSRFRYSKLHTRFLNVTLAYVINFALLLGASIWVDLSTSSDERTRVPQPSSAQGLIGKILQLGFFLSMCLLRLSEPAIRQTYYQNLRLCRKKGRVGRARILYDPSQGLIQRSLNIEKRQLTRFLNSSAVLHSENQRSFENILFAITYAILESKHYMSRRHLTTHVDHTKTEQLGLQTTKQFGIAIRSIYHGEYNECISNLNALVESLRPELNSVALRTIRGSRGRGGALFLFTEDKRYVIKTLSSSEFDRLTDMSRELISIRKKSLICPVQGVFQCKEPFQRTIYLMVMENLRAKHSNIEKRRDVEVKFFDLKGSEVDRYTVITDQYKAAVEETHRTSFDYIPERDKIQRTSEEFILESPPGDELPKDKYYRDLRPSDGELAVSLSPGSASPGRQRNHTVRTSLLSSSFTPSQSVNLINDSQMVILKDKNLLEDVGRLTMKPKSKRDFLLHLESDLHLLQSFKVMDYSVLLIMYVTKSQEAQKIMEHATDLDHQLYQSGENENTFYRFGIIDFLQSWNLQKVVEKYAKRSRDGQGGHSAVNPAEFSYRMYRFFDENIEAVEPEKQS